MGDFYSFAKNQALCGDYYKTISTLVGTQNLSPALFENALKILSKAANQTDWVNQRLWSSSSPSRHQSFSLMLAKSYSRNLDVAAWRQYYKEWAARLEQIAKPLNIDYSEVKTLKKTLMQVLADTKTRAGNLLLELELSNEPEFETRKQWIDFCHQEKSRPEVIQLSAGISFYLITKGTRHTIFESGDADLILHHLTYLRGSINKEIAIATDSRWEFTLNIIKSLILENFPKVSVLKNREDIFPSRQQSIKHGGSLMDWNELAAGEYIFQKLNRKFDILMALVAAGDCGVKHDLLRRWGSILSEGSLAYMIYNQNRNTYHGVVMIVPVQDQDGKIWATVEPFSALLSVRCSSQDEDAEASEVCFTKALRKIKTHLPEGLSGILIGQDEDCDNFGTLTLFASTQAYLRGQVVDNADFKLADQKVEKWIRASAPDQKLILSTLTLNNSTKIPNL